MNTSRPKIGVVVVDHGSKREESNRLLLDVVEMFRQTSGYAIVEPAHMELADPTIATAYDRCVAQGAELVVVHPYFLAPGKHWKVDIPALVHDASRRHDSVRYLVTEPIGLHPLMASIMQHRIEDCLSRDQEENP